jgi:uncharacterized protein (DUF58 family)
MPLALGAQSGGHLQRSRGRSLEFAEHRDYTIGDDLRHLDWNAYARLDRFVVKTYHAEADQILYFILDHSGSMAGSKLALAQRLAAALSYVTLLSGDRAGVGLLQTQPRVLRPVRGIGQWNRIRSFLQDGVLPGQQAALDQSISKFCHLGLRPGTAVIISDLLEPGAGLDGIKQLLFNKFKVALLQILDPEDCNPSLNGDLKLYDPETAEQIATDSSDPNGLDVTISQGMLRQYREALATHQLQIAQFSNRYQILYQTVYAPQTNPMDSSDSHETDLQSALQRILGQQLCKQGWLKTQC